MGEGLSCVLALPRRWLRRVATAVVWTGPPSQCRLGGAGQAAPNKKNSPCPSPCPPQPAADAAADSRPFDKFLGNDAGAFAAGAGAPLDADDVEADAVWAAVDARVEGRRKAGGATAAPASATTTAGASREAQLKEAVASFRGDAVADSFADLKRKLADVSASEWDAIPDIGDTTIKKTRREFYAPPPDTLLAAAAAERETVASIDAGDALTAGGSLTEVGDGRRTVVSLNLDRAADSVDGQTVVDPRGYLTSLASVRVSSAAEIGDTKKARTLLRSVTATNPRHAPGWVAAARLEEVAGDLAAARALAAQGCELCPTSEDVWLEAARLAKPGAAKSVLARGVGALPRSVRLWLAAAALEGDKGARSRVLRRALERVPTSVRLWKAAVDLAPADDARVLLSRAVECCPQHTDLWLALARLESHANARTVLNKARLAVPTDRAVWLAAARLEEANGGGGLVPKTIERALASLTANSVVIDRDEWLKVRGRVGWARRAPTHTHTHTHTHRRATSPPVAKITRRGSQYGKRFFPSGGKHRLVGRGMENGLTAGEAGG